MRSVGLIGILALVGCEPGFGVEGAPCNRNGLCLGALVCVDGTCRGANPGGDAGSPPVDAGARDASLPDVLTFLEAPGGSTQHPQDLGRGHQDAGAPNLDQGPSELGASDLGADDLGGEDLGAEDLGAYDLPASDLGLGDLGPGDLGPGDLGPDDLGAAADAGWADGGTVATPQGPVLGLGRRHSCFVHRGSVRCWGSNASGELGDGTTTSSARPVTVSGITSAVSVVAGASHTCALTASGGVACWGSRLGNGVTQASSTPVAVAGLGVGVIALDAGLAHTCAVLATGRVRCWGDNDRGQLGNLSINDSAVPVEVSGLTDAVDVACGFLRSCALRASGEVVCWGRNSVGQLGDGTRLDRLAPVAVQSLTGVADLSAGYDHTCALLSSGGIRCWGWDASGQRGDGSAAGTSTITPTQVIGIGSAVSVTAGREHHTCAALASGSLACWGLNSSGQLGDGTTRSAQVPAWVPGLTSVSAVSGGQHHTCAVSGPDVLCWGGNDHGQLGDGTTTARPTPAPVRF